MMSKFSILIFLVVMFIISCCGNKIVYVMDPKIGYLDEDNDGILICRYTYQGTKICERNLDYYRSKKQEVKTVPTPARTWE